MVTLGPQADFWVPIGAPFAVQIPDKRHLGMNACTLGVPRRLQDELKTVQTLKIDPAWYRFVEHVMSILCPDVFSPSRILQTTAQHRFHQSMAEQQLTRHSCAH